MQPPRSERELFADVLHREVGVLQARFPELADALSRAYAIVAGSRLFVEDSGREAMVLASDGTTYYHVNGRCQCKASIHRNEPCKHRLALRLYQRVSNALREEEEGWEPVDTPAADTHARVVPHTDALPAEALLMIQGKSYIRYAGLLSLAHQRGLQALRAAWTYNDAALSLAHAVAVFPFGTFEESGDATPENCTKKVAGHFRRVALTRAKARVLRDALGLDMVAVEELSEEPSA